MKNRNPKLSADELEFPGINNVVPIRLDLDPATIKQRFLGLLNEVDANLQPSQVDYIVTSARKKVPTEEVYPIMQWVVLDAEKTKYLTLIEAYATNIGEGNTLDDITQKLGETSPGAVEIKELATASGPARLMIKRYTETPKGLLGRFKSKTELVKVAALWLPENNPLLITISGGDEAWLKDLITDVVTALAKDTKGLQNLSK